MSYLSLPIAIRKPYDEWRDININEIRYTELRKLQIKLDANRQAIKDLAAVVRKNWSSAKVEEMLNRECPGEELLHEIGMLNKTLGDVIGYMQTIEFWPGLEIFLEPFPPLIQLTLPRTIHLKKGQSLSLECRAAAVPAPVYQWYYYPQLNPCKLEGESKAKLTLAQPEWLNGMNVRCSICNVHGQIYTTTCQVKIDTTQNTYPVTPPAPTSPTPVTKVQRPLPTEKFTAKDKVALLIGNGEYLCEKKLSAPPHDILRIGEELKRMNFKTLICKDLTKANMENVLSLFYKLLVEDGVYGVLYFAGHGFETHHGNCYLVPSDSPTQALPTTCISAREVMNKILEKNPALCLVVLDICRVRKSEEVPANKALRSNNSTMVVYATTEDNKAFEMQGNNPLSVFATHLLKYIKQPIPLIELMLNKVVPSISEDKVARRYRQTPEVTTTLATRRGLYDPIDHHGATTTFQKCMLEWESVNQRPELQEHDVPDIGITVKMVFTHEYSNSLIIYIGCIKKDPQVAFKAHAHVSWIEQGTVSAEANQLIDSDRWPKNGFYNNPDCMSVTKNVLDGIENLDNDLLVNVTVDGSRQDGDRVTHDITNINLKRPLLAKVNFDNKLKGWQIPLREPVQHEEDGATEHDESCFQEVRVEQNSFTTDSYA